MSDGSTKSNERGSGSEPALKSLAPLEDDRSKNAPRLATAGVRANDSAVGAGIGATVGVSPARVAVAVAAALVAAVAAAEDAARSICS